MTSEYLILKTLCGSRAYNLHREDSDWDYHSVVGIRTRLFHTVADKPPKLKSAWDEGEEQDNVSWEIGRFLSRAIHCDPNMLETFAAPVVDEATYWGKSLRELFSKVISRKRIYEAYSGYSRNQRKKMFEPTGGVLAGERQWKFAVAYLRSLHTACYLLNCGKLELKIDDGWFRDMLISISLGKENRAFIVGRAEELELQLTHAYLRSYVQEEPDIDTVNEWLWDFRKSWF